MAFAMAIFIMQYATGENVCNVNVYFVWSQRGIGRFCFLMNLTIFLRCHVVEALKGFEKGGFRGIPHKHADLFCILISIPQEISCIFHAGLKHFLTKAHTIALHQHSV